MASSNDDLVPLTEPVLYAMAKNIDKHCREENRAFMKCKAVDPDPYRCLQQGETTTKCVRSVLAGITQSCPAQFANYAHCLKQENVDYAQCRIAQRDFEECQFGVVKDYPAVTNQ
eukprot:TRINITY_DN32445_c0_g1_i1.p1 TRINITY_DN32445_c0_g1~~TRINITY_DN32445_c0_g1_i1.p1  ORF type:complete len:115 (+),score=14.08 TRINITY_DN32445_c0_g1_i1:76-420(+)